MSLLETPKTPGEESDERRQSQVGRLCKKFVKLIEKFRQGSERYPQAGTFQKQQQILKTLSVYRKKSIKWLFLMNLESLLQTNGRQEQKKVIKELRGEVSSLNEKLNCISKQVDRQEQYSRRNCFLIHGITEENQENTDV